MPKEWNTLRKQLPIGFKIRNDIPSVYSCTKKKILTVLHKAEREDSLYVYWLPRRHLSVTTLEGPGVDPPDQGFEEETCMTPGRRRMTTTRQWPPRWGLSRLWVPMLTRQRDLFPGKVANCTALRRVCETGRQGCLTDVTAGTSSAGAGDAPSRWWTSSCGALLTWLLAPAVQALVMLQSDGEPVQAVPYWRDSWHQQCRRWWCTSQMVNHLRLCLTDFAAEISSAEASAASIRWCVSSFDACRDCWHKKSSSAGAGGVPPIWWTSSSITLEQVELSYSWCRAVEILFYKSSCNRYTNCATFLIKLHFRTKLY